MWKRLRYRRWQALVVVLLSSLVVTCAVFAPLFDRATQQALVRIEVARLPVAGSGVALTKGAPRADAGDPSASLPVPASLREVLRGPIRQDQARVTVVPDRAGSRVSPAGALVWRAGSCRHVRVLRGRCPTATGEVAVSAADVQNFGYSPGTRLVVGGEPEPGGPAPRLTLTVVGVFRQQASAYWFDARLAGVSGTLELDPTSPHVRHDAWLTPQSTFSSPGTPDLPQPRTSDDYLLRRSATGVDELLAAGAQVRDLRARSLSSSVTVETSLDETAADVAHQRGQSRVIIPLLTGQLGLLAVVVLWFALGAATEQRRQEVAISLLRGRGRRGARRVLLGELLPVVLLGVPLGVAAAFALDVVLVRVLLPGRAPVELRAPPVLAALGSAIVLGSLTAYAVRRVTREPLDALLRSVPARRGWRPEIGETVLGTFAVVLAVAFVIGALSGPTALVAPALLALAVGMLLARTSGPLASRLGRVLLERGRVRAGVSVLDVARSPTTRRTLALLTVGTALVVFSADALAVGARNREYAAQQTAGAPLVANVSGSDLGAVRRALRQVDPEGREVTPVVASRPAADGAPGALAVVPDEFRRIALFPDAEADGSGTDWSRLGAPTTAPVRLVGDRITGRLSATALDVETVGGGATTARVTLEVVTRTNEKLDVPLLTLGSGDTGGRFSAPISCTSGCALVGLRIDAGAPASITGNLLLDDVTVAGSPVALRGSTWGSVDDEQLGALDVSGDRQSLRVGVRTTSVRSVRTGQAWLPSRFPAITTSALPAGTRGGRFDTTGIDGEAQSAQQVARAPRAPGSGPGTVLMNLDVVARGRSLVPDSAVTVWFAADDPPLLARVTRALRAQGVRVTSTTTLVGVLEGLDRSTSAWSLQLGSAVGVVALLTLLLALVMIGVFTWRQQSRDLAALRMVGLSSPALTRVASVARGLTLAVALVAGAVCGLVGAHFALPSVPLLARTPEVSTLDVSTAWAAVGITFAVSALALGTVSVLSGRLVARRAALQRLREPR